MTLLLKAALVVSLCVLISALITLVAYFAFDRPVVMLLPGAVVADYLWPAPAPLDLAIVRMLITNVILVATLLALGYSGLAILIRSAHK